ncbi:FAD-binding Berberine family protein [Striga hermonthica]|uniref:FAD-binding Berberine family protein n=1 Tax=Striga hermonthica TaxID=68872 RepID=A0A9N7RCE4_STRHE|nr:FAD-binding Berberine family protein [Striga hermonthica]
MKTSSSIALFSLLFSLTFSLSWASSSPNNAPPHEAFVWCLQTRSDPSNPILPNLYTRTNSSYQPVLEAYIRNLRFNESTTPKPRLILTATHVSHIQSAVVCAKSNGLEMRIRSGGHDYEGISYRSTNNPNFFVLDMFNLRSVNVNTDDESAWIESGATLGEVYHAISEASGILAFPAGVCPTVGVGGHISGGGYGNMMRKFGLSVDHVTDARIVDVNGRILDRKSMGEDLFWAITGGGGASFGVVLSYKINLVQVPPEVTVFRVRRTNDGENFTNLVDRYQRVMAGALPEDLFLRLTLDVANRTNRATFTAMFLGSSDELLRAVSLELPELGLTRADCLEMKWIDSVLFWTNFPVGTPTNALLSRVPQTLNRLKRKSDYLQEPIPKQGLESIFGKMLELQYPSLVFNPYGGKMAEILPSAKPFPHRAGNIAKFQYAVNWDEAGEEAEQRYMSSITELHDHMTPYVSKDPRGAFFNYRDLDIGVNGNGKNSYREGAVYGVKYFRANFNRLVKIKTRVDSDNFFRNEQSIPVLPWKK